MGSEDQYIVYDDEATIETISEGRGGICVEEEEERMSVEKLDYGIEPEKMSLRESTQPQFLLKYSCESDEKDELTTNSPDLTIVDAEVAASVASLQTTRRQWFKGLRSRLRRFFLCCNAIEED
ncbi:unnamed protein product [Rodentolepis nana]|uniref:Uncharacterized protein n=1 Tax=Rodentolepis nana TaxID=102285 RepID=A0A0R3TLF0_RODNA|nr:unnamed protein product [Rodentolepis nana]